MCENLLFFLTSLNSTNKDFIKKLLKHIEYSGFVATGEFIDHIQIISAANNYELNEDITGLWD